MFIELVCLFKIACVFIELECLLSLCVYRTCVLTRKGLSLISICKKYRWQ